MARTGRKIPESELSCMMTETGNSSGKISFAEFCKIMSDGQEKVESAIDLVEDKLM